MWPMTACLRPACFVGVLMALVTSGVAGCGSTSTVTSFAAPPVALADCHKDAYTLMRPGLNGATGQIIGMVSVRSHAQTPCRLKTHLGFSIRRGDGALIRQVAGNPAGFSIDARLGPGSQVTRDWAWGNWCGARLRPDVPAPTDFYDGARFRFVASVSGQTKTTRTPPPRCDSRRAGSKLIPFGPAG
jgi:hypothetical protein